MSRPKGSLVKKRKVIEKAQSLNSKFQKIRKKGFTKRIPGTAQNSLKLIGKTIYMPDFRNMQEIPFYIHHKTKLSPSIFYEQMHFVSRNYIKSEMSYGTNLHKLFSFYLRQINGAIVDFPSGFSSREFYWISFKPDGIFPTVNGLVLIELKTLPKEEYSKYLDTSDKKPAIPLKVEYQIQSYMNILQINKCLLCIYCIENGEFQIIEVQIDRGFVIILKKSFRTFIRLLFRNEGVQVKNIPKECYKIEKFDYKNKMVNYKGKTTLNQLKFSLEEILKSLTSKDSQKIYGQKIKEDRSKAEEQKKQIYLEILDKRKKTYLKRRDYFQKNFGRNTRC